MRYLLLTSVITIAAMPAWAQGNKGSEETTTAASQPTLRNAQSRVTTREASRAPATPPTEPAAKTPTKTPTAPKELAIEDFSLVKLLQGDVTPSYGFSKSPVEIHAFLNAALWYLGEQSLGTYANEGGSLSGRPVFITYSGYIDVSCKLSSTVMAEAEFELYKGEKGEFKVTKLRGVWAPNKYLVTQYSLYVSAGYKLFKGRLINFIEPLFRFEVMDSWLEDQQNRGLRYMAWLGIRFSPIKHWVIKVAAALQWEPHGDEISNNAFIAETVFDF